jgi:nucleoside-diphosphate-sugar epimerase
MFRQKAKRGADDVVVVTGAGGFLGSRVVPLFRQEAPNARVIAAFRHPAATAGWADVGEAIYGDLGSASTWRQLPSEVTHVVHLAAAIPWDKSKANDPSVVSDNLAPIAHLVHESSGWPRLRQVVYGSSVSVYTPAASRLRESSPTQPASVYGAAKLAGERLLDVLVARGVQVASLRYSSLYGAGQYPGTVLPLLANRARRGLPLEVFNARRTQDFVHVDDAARATWLAYARNAGGAFNIGSGVPLTMAALARSVVRTFDPAGKSRVAIDNARRGGDAGIKLDTRRAARLLGYKPRVVLADGLADLARDLRATA